MSEGAPSHTEYMREWRRRNAERVAAGERIPHGVNGYANYCCRCDVCRDAANAAGRERWANNPRDEQGRARHAERTRRYRERNVAQSDAASVPHGINGYANFQCRCEVCVKANSTYSLKRNRASMAVATNAGKPWTGADMQIAVEVDDQGRYVRTESAVAEMLGRSNAAVKMLRRRCSRDPRYLAAAGAARR